MNPKLANGRALLQVFIIQRTNRNQRWSQLDTAWKVLEGKLELGFAGSFANDQSNGTVGCSWANFFPNTRVIFPVISHGSRSVVWRKKERMTQSVMRVRVRYLLINHQSAQTLVLFLLGRRPSGSQYPMAAQFRILIRLFSRACKWCTKRDVLVRSILLVLTPRAADR